MANTVFVSPFCKLGSGAKKPPGLSTFKKTKPHYLRTGKFCARVMLRLLVSRNSRQYHWLREEIANMGPLYVKLGQVLSSRTDVIPEEIATVLKDLQSDVPPVSFDTVRAVFRKDFGKDLSTVFEQFDESPFASASIAQVHRANILDRRFPSTPPIHLAVKIQRPDIREDFEEEIRILKKIMQVVSIVGGRTVDETVAVLNDMERCIHEETNFLIELDNMKKFAQVFAETNTIVVPRVVSSLSSERVLTMEFVQSKKITDFRSEAIATALMRSFVTAVIERGYIHCDPHPGNIGITPAGDIVLYDYGMVSKLRSDMKSYLRGICMSVFNRDTDALGDMLLESGFVRAVQTNAKSVRSMNMEEYLTMHRISRHMYEYMDTLDMNIFFDRINSDKIIDTKNFPFKLDADMFFLFRSFSILEGVCKEIDPKFNYSSLMMRLFLDLIDLDTILEKAQTDMETAFTPVEKFDEERSAAIMRMERMDKHLTTRRNNERMMAGAVLLYILMHL